jgi:hypothetical protein
MVIAVSKLHEAGIAHNDISAKMFKVCDSAAFYVLRASFYSTRPLGISAPAVRTIKPQTPRQARRSSQSRCPLQRVQRKQS